MYAWLENAMREQSKDKKSVWKASAMHHPMFSIDNMDYTSIIDSFLPLLKQFNFDAYLAGHEHLMTLAYPPQNIEHSSPFVHNFGQKNDTDCHMNVEWFPAGKTSRQITLNQGEKIVQFTIGNSAKPMDNICYDHQTLGDFVYAQNAFWGFALVHVTSDFFEVTYKGLESDSNRQLQDLLSVKILRQK
jgi:hypothetical protein